MPDFRSPPALAAVGGSLLAAPALVGFLAVAPGTPANAAAPQVTVVDPDRELFITDLTVVEAPGYVNVGRDWHFGTMMERLAGNVPADEFVTNWIETWFSPQMVNGFPVFSTEHRASLLTFAFNWSQLGLTATGHLDPDKAPFRLLAIVNRPDLARIENGQVESAGEMRFVYGAHAPLNEDTARDLTVIFEFEVPADDCEDVVAWHQRWHALADHPIGSPDYLSELALMTRDLVLPDPASGRPNGSNIAQVRTNNFLNVIFWELREFNIDPVAGASDLGRLINVTTKQTPHFEYLNNFSASDPSAPSRRILREYLDANQAQIDAGTHVVPDFFASTVAGQTVSFQTGRAENSNRHPDPPNLPAAGSDGTKWYAPTYSTTANTTAANKETRHRFALQTCAGCHREETGTAFQMVHPRLPGQESFVADFITGNGAAVPDPLDSSITRPFDDLANRELQFIRILEIDCSSPGGSGLTPLEVLAEVAASTGTRVH